MVTHEEVGRRIRIARGQLGLSQGIVGSLLSPARTHAAVSDIERGKTRLDVEDLSQLAAVLQKDLSYFYGEDSIPSTEYRRGDRGLTPQAQQRADNSIEAFKHFARQRAAEQEQKTE